MIWLEYSKLDPKAKKSWRLARLIFLIFLLIIFIVVISLTGGKARVICGIVGGIIILLQLLQTFIYPEIEYRQWKYIVTDDRIEIKKGIFFHNTSITPISRIQHVTISEGPISRHYGLAKVEINTAGGHFEIEGLPHETAVRICEYLKERVNEKIYNQRGEADE